MPSVGGDYPLRLFGLAAAVPGQTRGNMCVVRLTWLDNELNQELKKPIVLCVQYLPIETGIEHMDVQDRRDVDALGKLLKNHKQDFHLLCGHVRRPIHTVWCGVTFSIAPSASHYEALDLHKGVEDKSSKQALIIFAVNIDSAGGIIVKNLLPLADSGHRECLTFSTQGWGELTELHEQVTNSMRLSFNTLISGSLTIARRLIAEKFLSNSVMSHQHLQSGAVAGETSNIHLETIRELRQINSLFAAVAGAFLSIIFVAIKKSRVAFTDRKSAFAMS